MSRRHVCTKHRNVTYPVRTKRVFCKPTYKKYMVRCGTQWCEGVRLVYEKYHKEMVVDSNRTLVDYICCPGWTQVTWRSHGCNKPVCNPPCKNGGKCVKPNQCTCPQGYLGSFCETKTSVWAPNYCRCAPGGHVCPPSVCPCCLRYYYPPCPSISCQSPPALCTCDQKKIKMCKRNGLQDEEEDCDYCEEQPQPPAIAPPAGTTPPCLPPCEQGICNPQTQKCDCGPGFTGPQCKNDVDECKEVKPCDQICYNTPGSYKCECKETFVLQKDGQTCRREFYDDGTTVEARDLEQDRLDKLDKRIDMLSKTLKEKNNNEVTKKDLANIYANIDKISNNVNSLSEKLQRLPHVDNYCETEEKVLSDKAIGCKPKVTSCVSQTSCLLKSQSDKAIGSAPIVTCVSQATSLNNPQCDKYVDCKPAVNSCVSQTKGPNYPQTRGPKNPPPKNPSPKNLPPKTPPPKTPPPKKAPKNPPKPKGPPFKPQLINPIRQIQSSCAIDISQVPCLKDKQTKSSNCQSQMRSSPQIPTECLYQRQRIICFKRAPSPICFQKESCVSRATSPYCHQQVGNQDCKLNNHEIHGNRKVEFSSKG